MTSLQDIPGLDPDLVPLLQAVGVETAGDLAVVPSKIVRRALEKEMGVGNGVPSLEQIEGWQRAVRSTTIPGGPGAKKVSSGDRLLVAEALSSKQLMSSGIAASAVPIARILGDPSDLTLMASRSAKPEALSHRTGAPAMARESTKEPAREALHPRVDDPLEVHAVESPRFEQLEERKRVEKAPELEEAEVEMKFPSTEERSRAEQDFERKNRGMTHKEPGRVFFGALALLLTNLLVLVGVGTVVTAVVMEYFLKQQVPAYLAFGLVAFPMALLLFLMVGTRPRCRLCGQRLFLPRQCRRHDRAHKSIFGYATSMALHVVCFRWFRCSLCGTKQRLK